MFSCQQTDAVETGLDVAILDENGSVVAWAYSEDTAKKIVVASNGWSDIDKRQPPHGEWLEFYDGNKTMGHHPPFNHIDIVNKRGEAQVNYIHNYTHWRQLTTPEECGASRHTKQARGQK